METFMVACLFLLASNPQETRGHQLGKHKRAASAQDDDVIRSPLKVLADQVSALELQVAERIRSDGSSGLKQVRVGSSGDSPYHSAHHTSDSFAAIHDHSDMGDTMGIGELLVVLNGVEFRTGHNDYRLQKPGNAKWPFNSAVEIEHPPLPPEMLKGTIEEQAAAMKKYFQAWQSSNDTVYKYKDYFKPVLCYLEGWWQTSTGKFNATFASDRHFLDAKNWADMLQKVRWTSYTGGKSNLENYAFVPTMIFDVTDEGMPLIARWQYRIACHQIKVDLPLNRFHMIDDLSVRARYASMNETKYANSRLARFSLNYKNTTKFLDEWGTIGLMDSIFDEIPGKDNYGANMTIDGEMHSKTGLPLNSAYYHRFSVAKTADAMGGNSRHRGFSDQNCWMATTSQTEVAGMSINECVTDNAKKTTCVEKQAKMSYALPLEIIWVTPLHSWNPYGINITWSSKEPNTGKTGATPEKAYEVAGKSWPYFLTPAELFGGTLGSKSASDTTKGSWMKGKDGKPVKVVSSGFGTFIPDFGLGQIRTRYPVIPIAYEGNTAWKEVQGLRKMIQNGQLGDAPPPPPGPPPPPPLTLYMQPSNSEHGFHTHIVTLDSTDQLTLANGEAIRVQSTQADGHVHILRIAMIGSTFTVTGCDDLPECFDEHGLQLTSEEGKAASMNPPPPPPTGLDSVLPPPVAENDPEPVTPVAGVVGAPTPVSSGDYGNVYAEMDAMKGKLADMEALLATVNQNANGGCTKATHSLIWAVIAIVAGFSMLMCCGMIACLYKRNMNLSKSRSSLKEEMLVWDKNDTVSDSTWTEFKFAPPTY